MIIHATVNWRTTHRLFKSLHTLISKPAIMVRGGESVVKLTADRSYEEAVVALNSLQTNAATLEKMRKERGGRMQRDSLPEMAKFLERIHVKVPELNKLNVIHVSGSKGKGSVCAMSESILRHCGLKTGFYSSPHLLEVRERIRINGRPLDKDDFAKYFWQIWDRLEDTLLESDGKMPAYFRFLTLLSYFVFLQEQVDVAVVEVGVGGQYDCTNIIREPVVCGITRLELEHTSVLGDTLDKIAWHKAGIIKFKRPAVTIPQRTEALEVLKARAEEMKVDLAVAPPLDKYTPHLLQLGLEGTHQKTNASLALQLCQIWLKERGGRKFFSELTKMNGIIGNGLISVDNNCSLLPERSPFPIPKTFLSGLTKVQWPGRNQVVSRKKCTFYFDGAHTSGSLSACAQWYKTRKDTDTKLPRNDIFRVLVFNATGERDCRVLLKELKDLDFDHAVFCPNVVKGGLRNADQANFTVTRDTQYTWCEKNEMTWLSLRSPADSGSSSEEELSSDIVAGTGNGEETTVFPCISDAVRWILCGKEPLIDKPPQWCPDVPQRLAVANHVQVLVTGSLHLVGGVMKYLGPELVEVI